ncbi:hypothetical protein J6590_000115 [Homalodisca vitripennis]|nr:hypothetical protein J6590_000115 [Homalodisca vitripennis]
MICAFNAVTNSEKVTIDLGLLRHQVDNSDGNEHKNLELTIQEMKTGHLTRCGVTITIRYGMDVIDECISLIQEWKRVKKYNRGNTIQILEQIVVLYVLVLDSFPAITRDLDARIGDLNVFLAERQEAP